MPRRARIVLQGTPTHVVQRGHNRQRCFLRTGDYRVYLRILEELVAAHGCALHAYVLMTNHVHLLLTPEHMDSLALLMKDVGQRYVQYVNRTYRRSGTLWEGRFKSCAVQDEVYLLRCHRYIELNPVRACIVHHPRSYPWSSYRSNAEGPDARLLTPHPIYRALGQDTDDRRAAYRSLFDDELARPALEEIRGATKRNAALGDALFRAQVEVAYARRVAPVLPRHKLSTVGSVPGCG